MSTVNPYSPPRAHVTDVIDASVGVQEVKLWSARGRIGRLRFLGYGVAAYLLFVLAMGVAGALRAVVHPALAGVVIAVAIVVYAVFALLISIQRSHDMDWSGWTILLALVPLVGLIWIFKGGTPGANRFGAPPPPNTWGVRVLAMLMPLLFIGGIIAAIALPAYQQYAQRAKAMHTGQ